MTECVNADRFGAVYLALITLFPHRQRGMGSAVITETAGVSSCDVRDLGGFEQVLITLVFAELTRIDHQPLTD